MLEGPKISRSFSRRGKSGKPMRKYLLSLRALGGLCLWTFAGSTPQLQGASALTSSGRTAKRTDLDSLGGLQRLLRRDAHLPLPQQLLRKEGDVPPGDGDVLNAAADDVAFSLHTQVRGSEKKGGADRKRRHTHHGNDVRDAVSAVDDGPRQRPLPDLSGRPGGGQRQDGLHQSKVPQLRLQPEAPPFHAGVCDGGT